MDYFDCVFSVGRLASLSKNNGSSSGMECKIELVMMIGKYNSSAFARKLSEIWMEKLEKIKRTN
jgi:hypothetical protein